MAALMPGRDRQPRFAEGWRCLLHLRSSDTSFETVILYGIPNLEQLADTLRECSLRERARRRVTTFVQA
jgi:hypothetical protein